MNTWLRRTFRTWWSLPPERMAAVFLIVFMGGGTAAPLVLLTVLSELLRIAGAK